MNKHTTGFTLMELMIVVAIIGILTAIAVPIFRDYTMRAKISEAIILMDMLKSGLSEAFISDGETGVINFATRVNGTDQPRIITNKISAVSINITDADKFGHMTVTLGNIMDLPANENKIAFSPHINHNTISKTNSVGVIQWVCAGLSGTAAKDTYPDASMGTMSNRYITGACR